jgi:hypothetical protein
MNVNYLIDAIVRQTTVLIAQLATSGGRRPSLAHTANQVFVDLVSELKRQGVGNKVIADMFGLALRGYHAKVSRLQASATYGGKSLWEAVLEFIRTKSIVTQADVLARFRGDDVLTVRSVLSDLVDSGLVFRTDKGDRSVFRAVSLEEMTEHDQSGSEGIANLVWVGVNRLGSSTRGELSALVPIDDRSLETALELLVQEGRVSRHGEGQTARYSCDGCVIPLGEGHGWEAAVFDHYQAMVTALCAKLNTGALRGEATDHIGGSTYTFCVWDDHPMREQVLGFLGSIRIQAMALRQRVAEYNQTANMSADRMQRVVAYVGQTVIEPEVETVNE